jgi:hypothetical protein
MDDKAIFQTIITAKPRFGDMVVVRPLSVERKLAMLAEAIGS